jgi:signal transduction histidine kinase
MATAGHTNSPVDPSLPEALARTLRHEFGDFLHTVYVTVALLQRRLPADATAERGMLTHLRDRAESCKHLLDAVQDFLCPLSLTYATVDLVQLLPPWLEGAAQRHPTLKVQAVLPAKLEIEADAERLLQVGDVLLENACAAARRQVCVCLEKQAGGEEAAWTITDDGPGITAAQRDQLFKPFFSTRPGHAGLGLALARKLVHLHGGRITAENRPTEGFCVQVFLPSKAPDRHSDARN